MPLLLINKSFWAFLLLSVGLYFLIIVHFAAYGEEKSRINSQNSIYSVTFTTIMMIRFVWVGYDELFIGHKRLAFLCVILRISLDGRLEGKTCSQ